MGSAPRGAVDLVSTDRNRSPPGGAPDLWPAAPQARKPARKRGPPGPGGGVEILEKLKFSLTCRQIGRK